MNCEGSGTVSGTDLDAIRERAEEATLGPWELERREPYMDGRSAYAMRRAGRPGVMLTCAAFPADAEFIAHAREDVPVLLAEVERLRQEMIRRDDARRDSLAEVERLRRDNDNLDGENDDIQAEVERLRAEVEMKSDRAALFRDAYRDLRSGVRMSLGLPDVPASIDEQREQLAEIELAAQHLRAERDRLAAAVQRVEALCDAAEPSTSISPVDCLNRCAYGPCVCSGVRRVLSWTLDPAAVRAALDGPTACDHGAHYGTGGGARMRRPVRAAGRASSDRLVACR